MSRAAAKERTLARIGRVRTLQLGLAQAEEMRERDALGRETAFTQRIAGLVETVAPSAQPTGVGDLQARAHYRERLHQSAVAAEARVRLAEERADVAAEATRAARRDQGAVEKLAERARAAAAVAAMRALADAPAPRKRNWRDPC